MNRFESLLPGLVAGTLFVGVAAAQGYTPDEAVAHMTTPPGFEVSLVASEPMVRQPVAIEFDDRGRLWVVQYLQYPNPEGLKRVEVDRYSRTKYDRVPDPPPHGPKGGDLITILEDTDGDGRADTSKNFVEGLNLASSIAFGHGGVFVLQVPYLLFYPDRDRDDVPDSDPEVLLTGFGMEDAHSVANSLTWGPDGWLYGLQGSTVTAHIRGHEFQQAVWRYHPLSTEFELFVEGGGNMWGMDFDRDGNLLTSTNLGPYVMLHAVQGGYYWKSFGKHGALHNPYTYGYFEHVTPHNAEGGHVADGGIVYDYGSFPEAYNGKYIVNNLLSHLVHWHDITPLGSTFETWQAGTLLDSNDTWFAPCDLTAGPDGSLYVADWNDRRTAHPDPDADWDRSNGRIYRIAAKGVKPVTGFDLRKLSSGDLVALLAHKNKWYLRRALVLLAERRDADVLPTLERKIFESDDPHLALNGLFGLYCSGGFSDGLALRLLESENPLLRRWTVRFLGDTHAVSSDIAARLVTLTATEPDIVVRSQLASSARRLDATAGLAIANALLERNADAEDTHIPLLLWWAVEQQVATDREEVMAYFGSGEAWQRPFVCETILPRLARRVAADGSADGEKAALRLLAAAPGWTEQRTLLAALDEGLGERGKTVNGVPLGVLFDTYAAPETEISQPESTEQTYTAELLEAAGAWLDARPEDPVVLRLGARLDLDLAQKRTLEKAADTQAAEDQRLASIQLLGRFGRAGSVPVLLALAKGTESAALREAALGALRHFDAPEIATSLLDAYPNIDEAQRARVRGVLFSRLEWSEAYLLAIDGGTLPFEDVPLEQLRLIAQHDNDAVTALVEKHWGAVRAGTPEEKLADMRRLNNELNRAPGNPQRGHEVFTQNCAKCHQIFGEGTAVAPDLTQSNRMDREYLLVSTVDPSLVVRKEYRQYIIETSDGGLYNGLIIASTPGSLTLLNAVGERVVIAQQDIEEMRESEISLMPEGLVTGLPGDDIRDLFAYLQSQAPEDLGNRNCLAAIHILRLV